MKQSPLQIIKTLIPKLTDKERDELKKTLTQETPSPCSIKGHNFKPVKTTRSGFLYPKVSVRMVCIKCGEEKTI